MELTKYKYIKNTKSLPGYILGDDESDSGFYNWSVPQLQTTQLLLSGVPTNFRTPITQNIPPHPVETINDRGVMDYAPYAGGNMKGSRGGSSLKSWNSDNITGALSGTIAFAGDLIDAHRYDNTAYDLMMDAGRTEDSVMGQSYIRLRMINKHDLKKQLRTENTGKTIKAVGSGAVAGGSIGSMIMPGLGTAVGAGVGSLVGLFGGLLGGSNRKRKMLREAAIALQRTANINEYNRDMAMSDVLQRKEAGFIGGKDEGVYTPNGKFQYAPNARVAGGETIMNSEEGSATLVKDGKYKVDGPLAYLRDKDVVLGADKDVRTGVSFMDEAAPYTKMLETINKKFKNAGGSGKLGAVTKSTQELALAPIKQQLEGALNDLKQQQKLQHELIGHTETMNAKHGKDCLPGFKLGGEAVPGILGTLASMYLYFDASRLNIKRPNTYHTNPHENMSLTGLRQLNVDPEPIKQLMRDEDARATSAINQSGASAAHKYLARVAQAANYQTAIANMMPTIQQENNKLASQYYNTAINAGLANRTALTDADRWDLDYYSKSHAAKLGGQLMGLYNFMNNIQQWYANASKRSMYDKMLKIYSSDLDKDQKDAILQILKGID